MSFKTISRVGLFLFFVCPFLSTAQNEQTMLEKIIPASPTAAALAKYGDIPVNYYSGSPSISVPLFNISSGKLGLPVNLSYQFNGLRTEEIASWVGLGWSLNAGGAITRSVRGLPDEFGNGYMHPISMTVQYMIDHPTEPLVIENLKNAGKGLYDTEPDLFFYNFNGYSGKFYYSQETQKFHTLPKENLSVSYTGDGFFITTPDGNKYRFDVKELTSTTQSCDGNLVSPATPITSSWFLSTVKNSNETEVITYEYSDGSYSFDHLNTVTKYFLTQQHGNSFIMPPGFPDSYCTQNSGVLAKRLSRINFRNGYLTFTTSAADRCDLPGDKALQKIELFDNSGNFIKRYVFDFGYFGDPSISASGCTTINPNHLSLRLKLKSIQEEGVNTSSRINPYIFEYDENSYFPSRLSYAQDYWGYNNGAVSNTSLIPPTSYNSPNGPIYFPGANRLPNFNAVRAGSIKKIIYPTKGSTNFVFENNEIYDPQTIPSFIWKQEVLEGDHNGGQQTYYERTFTINEPSSPYNFYHPDGGAYVDIEVESLGCVFVNHQATNCAVLMVDPLTPGGIGVGPVIQNIVGRYFPNGTYRMTASFNQNPPLFEDFYFGLRWKSPDTTFIYTRPVGGIRIKEIYDHDAIDPARDIKRVFEYIDDATGYSSGKVYSYPFDFTNFFLHEFYNGDDSYGFCSQSILYRYYMKRSSVSSYPLVSAGGGNYVGYEKVKVMYSGGTNGKSEFHFKSAPDLVNTAFPQTTSSNEWRRGLLLKSSDYQQGSVLKTKQVNDYAEIENNPSLIANGIKVGFSTQASQGGCGWSIAFPQRQQELAIPIWNEYPTNTGRSVLATKTMTSFEGSNQITKVENYTYNTQNFQPFEAKVINSKGETIITKNKYNIDYNTVSGSPLWLYNLQQRSVNSFPVEKIIILKKTDNTEYVIGGSITSYKSDKPLPDKVYSFESNIPIPIGLFIHAYVDGGGNFIMDSRYKEVLSFNQYDEYYNLRSQQKTNDVVTSYIWGYNKQYPVAQIVGMDDENAVLQSGVDLSIINNPTTDDLAMRTELNKLRSLPEVLVSTYTYANQKGITSETSPTGLTVFYEYDVLNRLSLVKDKDNNILKKICYNYASQPDNCGGSVIPLLFYNETQSQTFTRNNCGPCETGSQVTYTVPANTYSSTVSVEAANQLALNDIAANGQNYANTNGTCTGTSVTLTTQNTTNIAGFTAVYTNTATGQVYSFVVPSTGPANIGCLPAGTYSLTISKPNNILTTAFDIGCAIQTGTSARFRSVTVSNTSCNYINIGLYYD
jgi:hypothetical protein